MEPALPPKASLTPISYTITPKFQLDEFVILIEEHVVPSVGIRRTYEPGQIVEIRPTVSESGISLEYRVARYAGIVPTVPESRILSLTEFQDKLSKFQELLYQQAVSDNFCKKVPDIIEWHQNKGPRPL